jgi:hypothetical protein
MMKLRCLILWCLCVVGNTFILQTQKQYRRVRLQYAFMLKKNDGVIYKTKDSVIENMSTIVKDDLTNDILYFMKFYHLTNDEQTSYFYIVFYELLSFMIKNEKNKVTTLHISLINMLVYILIKNIIINHYIHNH